MEFKDIDWYVYIHIYTHYNSYEFEQRRNHLVCEQYFL